MEICKFLYLNASFIVSDFLVASAIFFGKIFGTAEKSLRQNGFCTHFVAAIFTVAVAVADCERHLRHVKLVHFEVYCNMG